LASGFTPRSFSLSISRLFLLADEAAASGSRQGPEETKSLSQHQGHPLNLVGHDFRHAHDIAPDKNGPAECKKRIMIVQPFLSQTYYFFNSLYWTLKIQTCRILL